MIVAMVRRAETKKLLGIFWAQSLADLWWDVDAHGDPSGYEYLRMGNQGALIDYEEQIDSGVYSAAQQQGEDALPPPRLCCAPDEDAEQRLVDAERIKSGSRRWKTFDFADGPKGGVTDLVRKAKKRP